MLVRKQTYVRTIFDYEATALLSDMAAYNKDASIMALKLLLSCSSKSKVNTALQQSFGINKRHANGIIAFVEGKIHSAIECRKNHITLLKGKLDSVNWEIETITKKIQQHLLYNTQVENVNRNLQKRIRISIKPAFLDACLIRCEHHMSYYEFARFKLHNKKRYAHLLSQKISNLLGAKLHVNLGNSEIVAFVGSKDETAGNQICQLEICSIQDTLKIRVPKCLESRYGRVVEFPINLMGYGESSIKSAWATGRAITYRFIQESFTQWSVHISVDVYQPILTSDIKYGCIGIDLNEKSIAWCRVDANGNPIEFGQIGLNLHSKSSDSSTAILADSITELVALSQKYNCPLVVEKLNFQEKKKTLRSQNARYNRMLSGFAYNKFYQLLSSRCFKLGIKLISVNPAFSSLIGMVKFMSNYGMNSGTAAALVLARRAMNFSEKPPAKTAYQSMELRKHVWSHWGQIAKRVKGSARHSFFQPRLTVSTSLRKNSRELLQHKHCGLVRSGEIPLRKSDEPRSGDYEKLGN